MQNFWEGFEKKAAGFALKPKMSLAPKASLSPQAISTPMKPRGTSATVDLPKSTGAPGIGAPKKVVAPLARNWG